MGVLCGWGKRGGGGGGSMCGEEREGDVNAVSYIYGGKWSIGMMDGWIRVHSYTPW
jgi:hypothetical protein